jgi:hypothetical protein
MKGTGSLNLPPIADSAPRFGAAWVAMAVTIALHVADEAATDSLSVYNPAVRTIRTRLPFLPLPTLTLGVWLAGLILAILLLLALSPLAFRGKRWVLWASFPLAVLMFGNGLLHIAGSFYLGRLMPGVYSAPLLLIVSARLFLFARRQLRGEVPRSPQPPVPRSLDWESSEEVTKTVIARSGATKQSIQLDRHVRLRRTRDDNCYFIG